MSKGVDGESCSLQVERTTKAFLSSKTKLLAEKNQEVGELHAKIDELTQKDFKQRKLLTRVMSKMNVDQKELSQSDNTEAPAVVRTLSASLLPIRPSSPEAKPLLYTSPANHQSAKPRSPHISPSPPTKLNASSKNLMVNTGLHGTMSKTGSFPTAVAVWMIIFITSFPIPA